MLRTVTTRLDLAIDGRTNMVFSIAAARDSYFGKESLSFVLDGVPLKATELVDDHESRMGPTARRRLTPSGSDTSGPGSRRGPSSPPARGRPAGHRPWRPTTS